jgi:biotin carboxyl carrier protein
MNQTTSNPSSFGAPVLRRGDAWAVELESVGDGPSKLGLQHVAIDRILENNFPSTLRAEISFSSQAGKKQRFKMSMNSTTASATAVTSRHRRGNPSNPRHVIIPFPGKLVEVMVDVGDIIQTEDVVCVVQQMKMEIEIRAKFGGRVAWVTDAEDGEDVNEGVLAAELDLLDEKGTAKL